MESRALDIFLGSLNTDSTKKNYLYWLDRYMEDNKFTSYDELASQTPEKIQTDIENYVMNLKRMRSTKAMVSATVYSLFHFFAMNRVILNEKIIKKLLPEQELKVGGAAYSTEDIRKIILAIDDTKIKKHKRWYYRKPLSKALVLTLASSGMRLGAIPDLQYQDLEPIEDTYSIRVYARTRHEYITFITPEARLALDDYLTKLKLKPDTCFFGLNYDALRLSLYRLVKKAKVSTVTVHELTRLDKEWNPHIKNPRHRLDIPTVHGMRKRWNTILKSDSTINTALIEMMLGHTAIRLDEAYLKPTRETLFNEYKKGITALTVF
ncbi:MAG: site-specific integrase [Nitrosopumilus sp.]|nr:site-specific integrase [Nitrosopumilus sp.]